MANGKNAKTRQEDDCLDGVRLAVRQFDQHAPLGTYKMDQVISRFVSERGIPHYVVQSIRWHLNQAVLEGLHGKRHAIEWPVAKSTAALFLQKLREIRKIAVELRAIDPELLSSVLVRNPHDGWGNALDFEEQILDIEERTEDLLPQIVDQIDLYLAEIYLPTYFKDAGDSSNRTIKFTHYFIAELARRWKTIFGVEPKSTDLADMTELMGACLEDFAYPLSSTQRQSSVWISDRIRKQIFRN
jgi:hypothetical protein